MTETARRDILALGAAALVPGPAPAAQRDSGPPRDIILVPGGWHGGWSYQSVAKLLREVGHRVYTPSLTGLADRSHLLDANVNCSTHIADIVNLIHWERLDEILLCGHSYSGLIITAVADRLPGRIAGLTYLDAIVPPGSMAIIDTLGAAEAAALRASAGTLGGTAIPPPPASAFGARRDSAVLIDTYCTAQPFATVTERVELTGAWRRTPRKSFTLAHGWDNPMRHYHDVVKDDPGWQTYHLACGHDMMLDDPLGVTEILARECAALGARRGA